MATKADALAAKQRQQKIILIVGGVVFAALLAIQGPKLMKQLKGHKEAASPPVESTSTPDSSTSTPSTTPSTATTGGTTTAAVPTRGGQSAEVAGVVIRSAGSPVAGNGQLFSLTVFKPKDPFVQQVKDATTGGSGTTDGGTGAGTTTTTGPTTTGGGTVTPTTSTPTAYAYATVMVNGKPQQLTLKQVFPKGQPTFVLQGVAKSFVKIGVAGGKFAGGGAIKLEKGQTVTLMNTTTGQRFVMKLVYTGDQPEQIAGFKQPSTSSGSTTTTTTTAPATTTNSSSTASAQTSAYTP